MLFVARLAVLTKVTQIKTAFAVVHARIHPSVHARGCCERAGYLIRSPAYPLYVKPLHCSTASGISAGTALFFSATLTIDRLNLGQIPLVRVASHSHMHSPRCRMLRSRERRAAETSPQHTHMHMQNTPSLPNSHGASLCTTWIPPLPFTSGTHAEARVWMKHEVLEASAVQMPSSRLRCNLFKAETFLLAGQHRHPLPPSNQTGHLESLRPQKSIFFLVGNSHLYFGIWGKTTVCLKAVTFHWFE